MLTTTTVSAGDITSIAMTDPSITVVPHTRSSTPQAKMFDRRSQSDVMRAMSQPTGRLSKNAKDRCCTFRNAAWRMSWLIRVRIRPPK